MKRETREYLKRGMKVVKHPGSIACMADALATDAEVKRLRKALRDVGVKAGLIGWMPGARGDVEDIICAALKPQVTRERKRR